MVGSGQLLASLNIRTIVSMVSGETYVEPNLLMESQEFLDQLAKADSLDELLAWVDENFQPVKIPPVEMRGDFLFAVDKRRYQNVIKNFADWLDK